MPPPPRPPASREPSENAPDPSRARQPALPRSGIASGDSHGGWYCCRACLRGLEAKILRRRLGQTDGYDEVLPFVRAGLSGSVLAQIDGVPPPEDIEMVIVVKRVISRENLAPVERSYWFARAHDDNMYHEIRSTVYDRLNHMRSVDFETKTCGECPGISMEVEAFMKVVPPVSTPRQSFSKKPVPKL